VGPVALDPTVDNYEPAVLMRRMSSGNGSGEADVTASSAAATARSGKGRGNKKTTAARARGKKSAGSRAVTLQPEVQLGGPHHMWRTSAVGEDEAATEDSSSNNQEPFLTVHEYTFGRDDRPASFEEEQQQDDGDAALAGFGHGPSRAVLGALSALAQAGGPRMMVLAQQQQRDRSSAANSPSGLHGEPPLFLPPSLSAALLGPEAARNVSTGPVSGSASSRDLLEWVLTKRSRSSRKQDPMSHRARLRALGKKIEQMAPMALMMHLIEQEQRQGRRRSSASSGAAARKKKKKQQPQKKNAGATVKKPTSKRK
jgi:hypothetical protein